MRKIISALCLIIVTILLLAMLRGTMAHKLLVVSMPSRSAELVAWVDRKAISGDLMNEKDGLGSFFFVGNHDVDIDFERARYGLGEGAVARVVVDAARKPLSVVVIDGTYCGIAIALCAGKSTEQAFGNIPSDLRLSSPRVGTFCVERD